MSAMATGTTQVPYPQIKGKLQTGDLVFLRGDNAEDVAIEALDIWEGEDPFSHVAMIINDGGNLYLWDAPGGGNLFVDPYWSDPNNRIHSLPSAEHPGCRVASPLDDVLQYYASVMPGDQFWVRQLSGPQTPAVSADMFAALRIFIDRTDGLPFPQPISTGLAESWAAGQKGITIKYGSYFCAQLIADSYMHMGILPMEGTPPNGYTPGAFSGKNPAKLPLLPGYSLGPEINVTWQAP